MAKLGLARLVQRQIFATFPGGEKPCAGRRTSVETSWRDTDLELHLAVDPFSFASLGCEAVLSSFSCCYKLGVIPYLEVTQSTKATNGENFGSIHAPKVFFAQLPSLESHLTLILAELLHRL